MNVLYDKKYEQKENCNVPPNFKYNKTFSFYLQYVFVRIIFI